MENGLYKKRCDHFVAGNLEFVVTSSEYACFVRFARKLARPCRQNEVDLVFMPEPMILGKACVFYNDTRQSAVVWYCPTPDSNLKASMTRERIPFALMHDSQGIESDYDWGTNKIACREHYKNAKMALTGVKATIESALHRVEVVESHLNALGKVLGYE